MTSILDLLAQEEWAPEAPEFFRGQALHLKHSCSLPCKLQVYEAEEPGYFEQITGAREEEFLEQHEKHYLELAKRDLQGITIGEIREAYAQVSSFGMAHSDIKIVTGIDALGLVLSKSSANSICQVASQFNALESTNQNKAPLSSYAWDYTQGPRSVMPCLHELLKRHAGDFNAFQNILAPEDSSKFVRNGYVQWTYDPAAFLKKIEGRSDQLRILAMIAQPELSDHALMQVYSAAPPVNIYGNGGDPAAQLQIAKELVIPQYEALAMMAVIRASKLRRQVDLNVTFVGGGVFGNPPEVLNEAFDRMIKIVSNHAVRLAIHSYSAADLSAYPVLKDLPRMDGLQYLHSNDA